MSKIITIKKGREGRKYTKYNVNNSIKRYIKYKEKELGRTCRKIFAKENPEGTLYQYANFCKNYDKLIVTIAYSVDGVGWVPMEIGKDINLLPPKKAETEEYDIFVKELREITGLSVEYCSSAFYTLTDFEGESPKKAAKDYKKRYEL